MTAAFDELVLRKRAKVQAVARRLVGSDEDAKDVAQLAFIRVWERGLDEHRIGPLDVSGMSTAGIEP